MLRFRGCPMARTDPFSDLQFHDPDLFSTLSGVERETLEFKRQWLGKEVRIKRGPYWQVVQTITAFANDFYGNGGGYIVIGIDEKEKWPSSIVHIETKNVDRIRMEIIGGCQANIKPKYVPKIYSHTINVNGKDRNVLVIWAFKSNDRPHRCRDMENGVFHYYIRQGTQTKKVVEEREIRQLMQFLDSKVQFDDAQSWAYDSEGQLLSEASIDFDLLKAFLQKTDSNHSETVQEPTTLFKALGLVEIISNEVDHNSKKVVPIYVPKNVALLLFHPQPDNFFRGARTDVRVCTHGPPMNCSISGPIDQQIEEVMKLILTNTPNGAYPEQAVREIVTNAYLHRGYEESYNDPVEIKIMQDFIEVYSYPGPDPSLKEEHFSDGNEVPRVKCKNRRLLEFFRRVKLAEGWNTGIATTIRVMKENNNPAPVFSFTPECFRVRLVSIANCAHLNVRREDANAKDDDKSGDDDDDNDDNDDYHGDDDDDDDGDGDGHGSDYTSYGADDVDNEENNQRYEDVVGEMHRWTLHGASQRQPHDEHLIWLPVVFEHSSREMQETTTIPMQVGPPDGYYGISEGGRIVTQATETAGSTSTLRIPQEWPLNGYDPFIGDMLETAGSTMTETLGNSRSNVEPFWNQPGSNL